MEQTQQQPTKKLRGFAGWTPAKRSEVARKHAANHQRGFAAMSPERRREIARSGGKAAHEQGSAHKWTREEAQAAGRKGGRISRPGTRER